MTPMQKAVEAANNAYFAGHNMEGVITAALSALEAEWWVLVPKEPTEEMLRRAGKSPDGVSPRGGTDWLGRMLPKYYAAMLAARPTAASPAPAHPAPSDEREKT